MMTWLWQQLLLGSVLLVILLLIRPWLLARFGARVTYVAWSAVPLWFLIRTVPIPPWWHQAPVELERIKVLSNQWQQVVQSTAVFNSWLLIWGLGAAAFTLSLFWQRIRLQRLINQSEFVCRDGQTFYKHAAITSPMLVGMVQPKILVPANFDSDYTKLQQQLVIRHELTHWQRGDLQVNLLATCLLVVYWFNPICWLAYRVFRQDQELACDAAVLAHADTEEKIAYSYALLSCTHQVGNYHLLTTHLYGDKYMIKQRLTQLQRQQGYSGLAIITVTLLAAAVLYTSALAMNTTTKPATAQPILRVEPKYPVEAARQGIEGYVIAEFQVGTDGRVTQSKIIKSVPNGVFDKVALTALAQWRYQPSENQQPPLQVQLDFMMDETPVNVERVQVLPTESTH